MPNDQTNRGYLLPHPENIAVQDVVRIRNTIEKVDEDITKRENEHNSLKSNFERFNSESLHKSVDLIIALLLVDLIIALLLIVGIAHKKAESAA